MSGGGHGGGGIGHFFSHPDSYKGISHPHNGHPLMIPEQGIQNISNVVSTGRKYVEDIIGPTWKALGDIKSGFNFKENGFLAPLKGLAGATVKLLEATNRGTKGILDMVNTGYKHGVIDTVTSISSNTVDRVPWLGGVALGNFAKWTVSIPSYIADFVSNTYESYGPSAWIKWINKKVSNNGRDLPAAKLVSSKKTDDAHGHGHDNHGGGGDHH